MNDDTVAQVARYITLYHKHSFRVRSLGKHDEFELPICGEMDNLAHRLSNDYMPIDRLAQMGALQDIIRLGREELGRISEEAASAEKAAPYLDKAKEVYAEIEAAGKMMEMFDG